MDSKRAIILHWIVQGKITKENTENVLKATGVLPDGNHWKQFIENLLLWLGGLALSFSLMFFIAFNWDAMGRYARFGMIEACVLATVIVYWKLDSDKMIAKVSLMMASIFLGVLLAFFGQTYQTGADPWQLFFNWALLMLPWAIVARYTAIWLLWILLLNLSVMLYFHARVTFLGFIFSAFDHVLWVLFILNIISWAGWEFLSKKVKWMQQRWPIWLIATVAGFSISWLILYAIFDGFSSQGLSFISYVAWVVTCFYVYRIRQPDLFILSGLCLSLVVISTSLLARVFLEGGDAIAVFFILTIYVIGSSAYAAKWLKQVQKEVYND